MGAGLIGQAAHRTVRLVEDRPVVLHDVGVEDGARPTAEGATPGDLRVVESPQRVETESWIRAVVVGGDALAQEGLGSVLLADEELVVIGRFESLPQAVVNVDLGDVDPDVVVVTVETNAKALDAFKELRERHPGLRLIAVASLATANTMLEAFRAGAKGFVVQGCGPQVLRQAVRTVMSGGTFVQSSVANILVELAIKARRSVGPHGLTLQEMRVAALLPRGLTNRQIGLELGISEQTVKTHMRSLMHKLNARDRTEAAVLALLAGIA